MYDKDVLLERENKYINLKRRIKMNVIVEDSCISCGACESICDAVFSIEDKAVVNAGAVEANADAVQEAADACPVAAIIIE